MFVDSAIIIGELVVISLKIHLKLHVFNFFYLNILNDVKQLEFKMNV